MSEVKDKRPPLMPVSELALRLSQRADAVVHDLFGVKPRGGRVMLDELSGGKGGNVSVTLVPSGTAMPGAYYDFRNKQHGDIIDTVAHARFHGDKAKACTWAMEYLGLVRPTGETADEKKQREERWARERKRMEEKQKRLRAEADAAEIKNINTAQHIFFSQAQADIINTPVASYLLQDRGIDISLLPSTGACRYAPDCLLYETGELVPAMVLCVTGPNGKMTAVHRTYLECVDGIWRVIRRPTSKGKMQALRLVLGSPRGGHVSVSKGKSGVPLGRAPEGDSCIIAEGYETTCEYAIACPDLRCVSALNLGNMRSIVLPRTVTTRYFVKENGMSEQAEETFADVIRHHKTECDDVRIIASPQGYSDINDYRRDKPMAAKPVKVK